MKPLSAIWRRATDLFHDPFTRDQGEPPTPPDGTSLAAIDRARRAGLEADRQRAEMHRRVEYVREERRRDLLAPDVSRAMGRRR